MLDYRDRRRLSELLRGHKPKIAEQVTAEFLERHPEWTTRYGDTARLRGVEDACFHVDFLTGAIEAGAVAPFEDYVRWTVGMLGARGIAADFIAENLVQIGRAADPLLDAAQRSVVGAVLAAGCAACGAPRPPEAERDSPLVLSRSLFVQAILGAQRKAALNVALESLRAGEDLLDVYVEVLQEGLYEIGRLWASNVITVAQEHMATAVAQSVVSQIYAQLPAPTKQRGRVVITGVEGEQHQIGANMVADVLESRGYDVRFLGTQMPHAGILDAVEAHHADILGVSATMLFNLPQVTRLLNSLRERFGDKAPRIILGGAAFRAAPGLAGELGAVGWGRDLREAVALAG